MKLKELKDVIGDNSPVSLQIRGNNELPLLYDSWAELKHDLKPPAWECNVTLHSRAGILILLEPSQQPK